MKILKINTEELRELLNEELKNAMDFEWNGWRIPIYYGDDGKLSSGGWLSNNSWQPDAIELRCKVERWTMSDLGYEEYDNEDIDYEVNEMIDRIIDEMKKDYQYSDPNYDI